MDYDCKLWNYFILFFSWFGRLWNFYFLDNEYWVWLIYSVDCKNLMWVPWLWVQIWCKNSCCGESWLIGTNLMWLLLFCELCIMYWSWLLCIVYWSCVFCTGAGCCVLCIGVVYSVLELVVVYSILELCILYWSWLLCTVYWSGCCCYN